MHRWVDHAAELELELEATSERGVFEEALAALGGLLAERAGGDERRGAVPARHQVSASAPDRATLLAEWLSELAYLAESEGLRPAPGRAHGAERATRWRPTWWATERLLHTW